MNQNRRNTFPRHRRESGQAIVLMALMMVGLLAATGLAVDGGGMFFLWRDIRNASDAAVLASAFARCAGKNQTNEATLIANVKKAGLDAARINGFDDESAEPEDTLPDVVIDYPLSNPEAIANLPVGANLKNYVGVSIAAEKQKYFIQIVYPGPLTVSTYAVGNCKPRIDPAEVGGMRALGTDCSDGKGAINFTGSQQELRSDFHSNSSIKFAGSDTLLYGSFTYVTAKADNPVSYPDDDPEDYIKSGLPGTNTQVTAPVENPLELDIEMFGPGSEFEAELKAYGGGTGLYTYVNGDLNEQNGDVEGFYFVEGSADIDHANIGMKGVTIVARGPISAKQTNPLNPEGLKYYSEDDTTGTGGRGMLFITTSSTGTCTASGGIDFNGPEFTTKGLLYAPNTTITYSFARGKFYGAMIALSLDFSGARAKYYFDKSVIPPFPGFVSISQ